MSATLATHSDQTLFQPIAYAFDSTQSNAMKSSNPHSGCREVTVSKTLDASGPDPSKNQGGIAILQPIVLDNHPQDSRVTIREDGISPTLTEKMGTGGGNVPLILEPMGIQQNADGEVRMYPVSATLNTNGNASGRNAPLVVAPAIAYDCRNDAPNVEVSATLQAKSNGGQSLNYINPVFQPVPINDKATRCEGGGPTRNGDGSGNGLGVGKPGDPAPTLTAADRHAVAYGISRSYFNQGENAKYDPEITEEVAPTLTTSHCPPGVAQPTGVIYIARRFTPLECGRLQGFPDWWADGLGVQDPPSGLVDRWVQIFKTHWETITKATGIKSPKTRNQVIKWLKNPANDSALYKMWGNGIALPCAMFVMEGIAQQSRREETPCHIETQAT